MQTERLYYRDCYLREFDAAVLGASEDRTTIFLDRTAFYPTSGGQPHDGGTCNGIAVLDVADEGEVIAHKLASPLEGARVHGQIDWTRRYDHMQQHTGQHLLSAVFADLFGYQTVSFHMGPDVSTIELRTAELKETETQAAEERAARLIYEAIPVHISFADAANAQELRKASARSGQLRIVQIGTADRSACGGTHVASTAELGFILTRRQEKLRGNTRLEFVCGLRALHQAQRDFQALHQISRLTGAAIDKLPAQVETWRDRLAQAEKDRLRLQLELGRREGCSHWNGAPVSADGLRRLVLEVDSLDDVTRAMAQAFTEGDKAALLLLSRNTGSVLFAVSGDASIDAGKTLKQALLGKGGRGGGARLLAQGSVPNMADLDRITEELGFER